MHLTRAEISKRIPIGRKGTTYIVRSMNNLTDSVNVLIALRDMLHLAHTAREVKAMIKNRAIKINGRVVRDERDTIQLFNILEADKKYKLVLLPTGRFAFEETKESNRIAKVIGKKTLNGGHTQLNLHDGTNLITKEKIKVGDSVELDMSNKIKKVIAFEKGKKVFIRSGRSIGQVGTIKKVEGKLVDVQIGDRSTSLMGDHLIAP